jgi:DNA-binding MarR family transcriptional regulator
MSKVAERQDTVKTPDPANDVRTPAGDAFSGLVVRLFRLNGMIAAEGEALTRPAGQTTARWQVLACAEDAPLTVAQIARTLGLARQSVQRVADVLEGDDLIRYEDNPRHRRARLVTLTERGRASLARIQASQRPWANDLGAAVGERRLRQANGVLEQVLEAIAVRRMR